MPTNRELFYHPQFPIHTTLVGDFYTNYKFYSQATEKLQ